MSHRRVINQPPYKASFGSEPKSGLSSSNLLKELLPTLETEEDFEKVLTERKENDNYNVNPISTDETTNGESAISTDDSVDNSTDTGNNSNGTGTGFFLYRKMNNPDISICLFL